MAQPINEELIAITLKKASILKDRVIDELERYLDNAKISSKTTVKNFYKDKNLLPFKTSSNSMKNIFKIFQENDIGYQLRGEKNSEDCFLFLQGKNKEEIDKVIRDAIQKTKSKKPSTLNAIKELEQEIKTKDKETSISKEKNKHQSQER